MTSFSLPSVPSAETRSSTAAVAKPPFRRANSRLDTAAVVCIGLFVVALIAAIGLHPNIPGWLLIIAVLLPLAACVFGAASLAKPRPVGRGRARAAVTTGVVVCIVLLGGFILLPSLCRPGEAAMVAKCSCNMKNICAGLHTYANNHNGNYPPSLDALIADGMTSAVLVCPASNDSPATGNNTAEILKDLHEQTFHQSYVYIPPTPQTIATDGVVVYEHPHNHRHTKINVLFLSGEVRLLNKQEAMALIPALAKELSGPSGDN